MALNFDLSAVKTRLGDRWDELTTSPDTRGKPEGEQKWHPVTDTLIWMSMAVDLGTITEANLDEWNFRVGLLRKCSGRPHMTGGVGDFDIQRQDLVNHIGMVTNVTTKKRSQWLARIFAEGSYDEKNVTLGTGQSAAEQINAAVAAWNEKEAAKAAAN